MNYLDSLFVKKYLEVDWNTYVLTGSVAIQHFWLLV